MKEVKIIIVVTTLLIGGIASGCGESISEPANQYTNNFRAQISAIDISPFPYEEINETEKEGILLMREEEKLSRDIYIEMSMKYGVRIFQNISESEQTHMNAIKLLIDKYEIEDPVKNDIRGLFANPDLQELYNALSAKGNESLVEALKVGALIEEVDIIDLLKELDSADIDNQDIRFVYFNLLKGSSNHLRAFVKNLQSQGIIYSPQYLDKETFEKILTGQL